MIRWAKIVVLWKTLWETCVEGVLSSVMFIPPTHPLARRMRRCIERTRAVALIWHMLRDVA